LARQGDADLQNYVTTRERNASERIAAISKSPTHRSGQLWPPARGFGKSVVLQLVVLLLAQDLASCRSAAAARRLEMQICKNYVMTRHRHASDRTYAQGEVQDEVTSCAPSASGWPPEHGTVSLPRRCPLGQISFSW